MLLAFIVCLGIAAIILLAFALCRVSAHADRAASRHERGGAISPADIRRHRRKRYSSDRKPPVRGSCNPHRRSPPSHSWSAWPAEPDRYPRCSSRHARWQDCPASSRREHPNGLAKCCTGTPALAQISAKIASETASVVYFWVGVVLDDHAAVHECAVQLVVFFRMVRVNGVRVVRRNHEAGGQRRANLRVRQAERSQCTIQHVAKQRGIRALLGRDCRLPRCQTRRRRSRDRLPERR